MHAAACGAVHAIGFLAEQGVSFEWSDFVGRTPLMHAAAANRPETISALTRLGACTESRDSEGRTALMVAALLGRADAVERLIDVGADWRARDSMGKTPADLADSEGWVNVVEMLRWLNAFRVEGRFGLNLSSISHVGQSMAPGIEAGLGLSYRLSSRVSILNELSFVMRDSEFGRVESEGLPPAPDGYVRDGYAFEFSHLVHKPTLRYDIGRNLRQHFYVFAGGSAGILLASDIVRVDAGSGTEGNVHSVKDIANEAVFGVHAGLGFIRGTYWALELQYERDLKDAFKDWTGTFNSWTLRLFTARRLATSGA